LKVTILNHQEVAELLSMRECIEIMAEALSTLARGQIQMPIRTTLRPPGASGLMSLMPVYRSGEKALYGLKAICVFPQNPAFGKDAHQGSVLLFSAKTGELFAIINASAITAIRTAAVSAVATRLLSRKDAHILAILGAGVQARAHLAAMACTREIKQVRIADKIFTRARQLVDEMSRDYAFPVEALESSEAAVRGADIIVTVTNSSEPVLQRDWISAGAHVNAVGACSPQVREIDTLTMQAARLYVDRRESTLAEAGDYVIAAKEGAINPDHIRGEIGELLIGKAKGRTSNNEITLFKALGLAVEDLAAAEFVYHRAIEKNMGTEVDF
jgi:ornithine cyclodeaminase/alanine dehydrogenase-like protein (mu-crystallin family)